MAYAGKLFNPFRLVHKAEVFPGTGIGLAAVKRIIERNGGRIWIEGSIEKGATVYCSCKRLKPPPLGG
jgi:light-regulated signal transduction histidine kinase (bacteriophytochrome)